MQNDDTIQKLPPEIKKFNWGAFFLTWFWCIGNKCYLQLAVTFILAIFFAPFIGAFALIPIALYLGFEGNKFAYKKYNGNIENFIKTQKIWAIAGTAIILLFIIIITCEIYYFSKLSKDTIEEYINAAYNRQNYAIFCQNSTNKTECENLFSKMQDKKGKILKLKLIKANSEGAFGMTNIELYNEGEFEKSGEKIQIKTKIEKRDGKINITNIDFKSGE